MLDDALLEGRWVGERVDAHAEDYTWQMVVQNPWAYIEQYDVSGVCVARFEGVISVFGVPFSFGHKIDAVRVTILDSQHMLVAWITGVLPNESCEVVFSRPGLAELTAQQSYRRQQAFHAPTATFFITRWAAI